MKLALSADKRLRSSSIDMPANLWGQGEESNRNSGHRDELKLDKFAGGSLSGV